MAASNALSIGTGAASSSDITVTTTAKLVCLKDSDAGPLLGANVVVSVEVKGDDGGYYQLVRLTQQRPSYLLEAAGVYRVRRLSGSGSVGVFVAG